MVSQAYDALNRSWKSTCRVLLGDEIGAAQWVRTRAERDGREPIEDEA